MNSKRLIKIESLLLSEHSYLDSKDNCYFFGEYSARKGYNFSKTNQLILNLKKSVANCKANDWPYKEKAISEAAEMLKGAIKRNSNATFVPIPPSKSKSDPLYDDRILRLLYKMSEDWENSDIRELVYQIASTDASHDSSLRPAPEDLIKIYRINEKLVVPAPTNIIVVDDVLTTGSHFKAVKLLLTNEFPKSNIFGIFIARRALRQID